MESKTIEEAAKARLAELGYDLGTRNGLTAIANLNALNLFKNGANWQLQQHCGITPEQVKVLISKASLGWSFARLRYGNLDPDFNVCYEEFKNLLNSLPKTKTDGH